GQNATCLANGQPATSTNSGATGFTVDAIDNAIVTCTVYNESAVPVASVVVDKTWVINGTTFLQGRQPPNFAAALQLTRQPHPACGTVSGGYLQGDTVTVGETLNTTLLPPGCTAAAPTGDIGSHVLAAGLNTFAITNTITCVTTLTLLKSVVNPFGAPADP